MNKSLIASIIFAAGAFAFFVLVFPEFTSIRNAKAALRTRQALIEEKNMELRKVTELDKQYQARRADIDKILIFMPEQKRVDQIILSLQQMANEVGLRLGSIVTAAAIEKEGAGYKKILVSVDVVGQYPSFVSFLKLLEQNIRLYDVFEIMGSPVASAVAGGKNLINFNIKLNTYHLK
jgi:Tfp pilus assembly protein PilO